MSRSRRFATTAVFVTAATATLVVVVAETGGGATQEEYIARVDAICIEYGKKLDAIPPPGDLSSPGRSSSRSSRRSPCSKPRRTRSAG